LAGLAVLLAPKSTLSSLAKYILKQIVSSGAKFVIEHKFGQTREYLLMGGLVNGNIEGEVPDFITEDIDTLIKLKLLRVEYSSKGAERFIPTRLGTEFAVTC